MSLDTPTAVNAPKTREIPEDMKSGKLDVVKHRWIYIGISLVLLIPGLFFIISNWLSPDIQAPVRLGIDFTGGTMQEYGFQKPITETSLPQIRAIFEQKGYSGTVVQIQKPRAGATQPNGITTVVDIRSKHLSTPDQAAIQNELKAQFGQMTLLQNFSIGPSLASELLKNGFLALGLAYLLIVGYLTFRFEFDYAVCAIIALIHDALFVFGMFAILGYFFHTEVDSMFVTAILTVVGFSVHDTIVVFDRLRENTRLYFTKKLSFGTITNLSINQTLARSINTSMTALLTLLALYLFGGVTTRDFVFACILGIATGTYSSIFVASAMLTWWRERAAKSAMATA